MVDYATMMELPEKIENEWRAVETAFCTLQATIKEIQEGRNLAINGFLIDAKILAEAARDFYEKVSSIIAPLK